MSNPLATWTISLDTNCPGCNKLVDLLNHPEFWEGRRKLQPGETSTEQSSNLDVVCPKCSHAFVVDLEY